MMIFNPNRRSIRMRLDALRISRAKTVMVVATAILITAAVTLMVQPARAQVAPECADPAGGSEPTWQVNTAVDDQTPCSFRTLLTDADSGDTITFDPAVFPPDDPAVILVRLALPELAQGDLTIDGSGAGVIIDGSFQALRPFGLRISSNGNQVRGLHIKEMSIGIVVTGDNNIIGHAVPEDDEDVPKPPSNIISGNIGDGLFIEGRENEVRGNYIGVDPSGTQAVPNGGNGITILRARNVVGGAQPGLGNLISGNRGSGIKMVGHQAQKITIHGNLIGTDTTGLRQVANGAHGIEALDEAQDIVIGGAEPGQGNLISGNVLDGIHLDAVFIFDAWGNTIGADIDGTRPLPNGANGLGIVDSDNTVIGGSQPGEGNLISGNQLHGVYVERTGGASLGGNKIGADKDGTGPLPNGANGITIVDSSNINVGDRNIAFAGGCGRACNIISGNSGHGLSISGPDSHSTRVTGNFFGVDLSGWHTLPNQGAGIVVTDGAHDNFIGLKTDRGNIISGNLGPGIVLSGGALNNRVFGNIIGLINDAGAPMANQHGIILEEGVQGTQIGSEEPSQANIISGNLGFGVQISGAETHDNTIGHNFIGTNKHGHEYVGNGGAGVRLENGAHDNTVGVDGDDYPGNVIASNRGDGISISIGNENFVVGNRIGRTRRSAEIGNQGNGVVISDSSAANELILNQISYNQGEGILISNGSPANEVFGNHISFNQGNGVKLDSGASGNIIGRRFSGFRESFHTRGGNVIFRNAGSGVLVKDGGTSENVIRGNIIGTNRDGDDNLGNGLLGVYLDGGAEGGANRNTIDSNRIVNTVDAAVAMRNSDGNTIIENAIGLTWASNNARIKLGNFGQGIYLSQGSSENRMEANDIILSSGAGIVVRGGRDGPNRTVHNLMTENRISLNAGRGIVLDLANGGIEHPLVSEMEQGDDDLWKITGTACAGCTVEVFSDEADEGLAFEESVVADGDGEFVIDELVRVWANFRLTATDEDGNTSEFGAPNDLTITGIEITQAIQSLDNAVPLVAGKATVARVYVRSTFTDVKNVTAHLDGGGELGGQRLTPTGFGCRTQITVQPQTAEESRPSLRRSFCFRLPMDWVQDGTLTVHAKVNPEGAVLETNPLNNTMSAGPFDLVENPTFRIGIERVAYQEGMRQQWTFPRGNQVDIGLIGFDEGGAMAVGDWDDDGCGEVVIGRAGNSRIYVYGFSDCANPGKLLSREFITGGAVGGYSVGDSLALGDVTGNGRTDLLLAHGDSGVIDVREVAAFLEWPSDFRQGKLFAVGNVRDDDEAPQDEILIADSGTGEVLVLSWDGEALVDVGRIDIGLTPGDGFSVADVNGDGIEEFVVASDNSGIVEIFLWQGGREWLSSLKFDGNFTSNDEMVVGDVDGDPGQGDLLAEILLTGDVCHCVEAWKWDHEENAMFMVSRFDAFSGNSKKAIFSKGDQLAIGDIDGDGRADAVVADSVQQQIRVITKLGPTEWRLIQPSRFLADLTGSYIRRTFPFGDIVIRVGELPYPWEFGSPSSGDITDELKRQVRLANGGEIVEDDARPFVPLFGLVDNIAGGFTGLGLPVSRTSAGSASCDDPSCRPDIGAHEIGHTDIGTTHVAGDDPDLVACGKSGAKDIGYPKGRIGGTDDDPTQFFGFDVGQPDLGVKVKVYPGDKWFDFMTYCSKAWISDLISGIILAGVEARPTEIFPVVEPGRAAILEGQRRRTGVLASQLQEAHQQFLWVTAEINVTEGEGKPRSMMVLPSAFEGGIPATWLSSNSQVTVRLEAVDKSVLAEYMVGFEEPDPGPNSHKGDTEDRILYVDDVVPWLDGTAKVILSHQGKVLFSRDVSASPPEVTLTFPVGGETLGDSATVEWKGSDEDEDSLTYDLLYSADGGANWNAVVTRLPGTSYKVDTRMLSGSGAGLFRVIASDGVNTGRDDVDAPVAVAFKAPRVRIEYPDDDAEFGIGQTIILNGSATDLHGEYLNGETYQWISSLDGPLGTGRELRPLDLSVGAHDISLSVPSDHGVAGEARIRITVIDDSAPVAVEPAELPDSDATGDPDYLQPGKVSGRAITGPVSEVSESSFNVVTKQGEVTVLVNAETEVSSPPDLDLGMAIITTDPPTRVAVLSVTPPLSGEGVLNREPVTALKVIVIPTGASRNHSRVVISDRPSDGSMSFVSAKGGGSSISSEFSQGLETGDSLILMIRASARGNGQPQIGGVIDAGLVGQRLERLAAGPQGNPGLLVLLDSHLNGQQARLQRTLDKSPESLSDSVQTGIDQFTLVNSAARERLRAQGLPIGEGAAPEVKIISPSPNGEIFQGSTINIDVKVPTNGKVVSLEFTINGVAQETVADIAGFTGLEYPVPLGESSMVIQVRATDIDGNISIDMVTVLVLADPPPVVEMEQFSKDAEYTQGEAILLRATAQDNGRVVSAEFSVNAQVYPATLVDGVWTATVALPKGPPVSMGVSSSVLPHVFAGAVSLDGEAAPDGTVVTAWIQVGAPETVKVSFTAADDIDQTAAASAEITVLAQPVQVGQDAVQDGSYSIPVGQLTGPSFQGSTVTFKLGDQQAAQTGIWKAGEADLLDLSALEETAR